MASVFLIGFMATGKTTIGCALARAMALPFVDLDQMVEDDAGMSVADVFASEGEAGFRRREQAALCAVLDGADRVVATGGGTVCQGSTITQLRGAGAVVALTAPLDTLLARAGTFASRPLLAGGRADARALLRSRMPRYRQAHLGVSTADRPVEATLADVRAGLTAFERIPRSARADSAVVALGARSYPVVIGHGVIDQLGEIMGAGVTAAGIVTDDHVAPLYLDRVERSLAAAGVRTCVHVVAAGEASKRLAVVEQVADTMVAGGLDRDSVVVALGGGVVGDLGGFVAATLLRGIEVVQVPTSLLAMVDASIGGKTGVDLAAGKNLVGAFWQPRCVVADVDMLVTLPERERRAAFGELFKVGLLDSESLFAMCERAAPALEAGSALVGRCATYKAWVVSRDERERTGQRATLNLGHTIGHAIEVEAGYGAMRHGECVALGLIATARVSRALGLCDGALERRVVGAVRAAGLDADIDSWLRPEVIERVVADKKRRGSTVGFIALDAIGAPRRVELELDELSRILYD